MTEDQQTAGPRSHAGSPSAAEAARQLLSRLAELARTSLQTEASLAKQTVDLTWGTLVGDLDRSSANKAYVESVTRESARYWRTVGELGVDYASDLVTLGKSVSTAVLREVAAAGRKPGTRHTTGGPAAATESTPHHVMPEWGSSQATYSRWSASTWPVSCPMRASRGGVSTLWRLRGHRGDAECQACGQPRPLPAGRLWTRSCPE